MAEQFSNLVEISDSSEVVTISLDSNDGDVEAGGNGKDGTLRLRDAAGNTRVELDAAAAEATLYDAGGSALVRLGGVDGGLSIALSVAGTLQDVASIDPSQASLVLGSPDLAGSVTLRDAAGRDAIRARGQGASVDIGTEGNEGDLVVRDSAGADAFRVNGAAASIRLGANANAGEVRVADADNQEVIRLDGDNAALYVGAEGNEGDIIVRDSAGRNAFHLNGSNAALYVGTEGNEGDIIVRDGAGRDVFRFDGSRAALYVGASGNEGDVIVRDGAGRDVFHFNSNNAALYVGADGNEGDIIVRNGAGEETIHLNGSSGDILLSGGDCAEEFRVACRADATPGTVMVIGPDGDLMPSSDPYDTRVAGVISGAGPFRPGIILDRNGPSDNRSPVALAGKVTCKVDARWAAIRVGDLLTTSPTPGHAMRANDPQRAFGAVLGKALAPLDGGLGAIPILVVLG